MARTFRFAELSETGDEAAACKEEQVLQQMGSVELRIFRIENVQAGQCRVERRSRSTIL